MPFSLLYTGAVNLRNLLYDRNILKARKLPVPVISVGNLSVGGSGKTSLVRFLSQELGKTLRVAVVMRGYKRKSKGTVLVSHNGEIKADIARSGDEAYLLARQLRRASVVVSESRFEGGLYAVEELGAQVIILDDGFQHRRLFRDIDIVLLRQRDLKDRPLPAGLLREQPSSLKRADTIVLAYQEVEPFEFEMEGKPVFKMFREFTGFINSRFEPVPTEEIKGREVIAFAGLGSNEQFFKVLERLGFRLKKRLGFRDHYHYRGFRLEKDTIYITTPKDMVKLPPSDNLYALEFRVRVEGLMDFINSRLADILRSKTSY